MSTDTGANVTHNSFFFCVMGEKIKGWKVEKMVDSFTHKSLYTISHNDTKVSVYSGNWKWLTFLIWIKWAVGVRVVKETKNVE